MHQTPVVIFPYCPTRIIQCDESANLFAHETENHHFFPHVLSKISLFRAFIQPGLGCWQKVLFRPPQCRGPHPWGLHTLQLFTSACIFFIIQRWSVSEAAAGTAQLSFYIRGDCVFTLLLLQKLHPTVSILDLSEVFPVREKL